MVEEPSAERPPSRRFAIFSSLRYRDYRYLWLAQTSRAAAMWMEQIARPVLILQLTASPLLVGLVVSVRWAPQLLFGLLAGVAADRFDRKRILFVTQVGTMSTHLLLALLVLTDVVEPWHVFVLAFLGGTMLALYQPARQSIIPQLVPESELLNALALNTAAINFTRILGPALAVALLFRDVGLVYLLAGIIMLITLVSISRIHTSTQPQPKPSDISWRDDIREGLAFVTRNPPVLAVLGLALILFTFGLPYQAVFVPLFALKVLDLGDSGVAMLGVVTGVGALIGSLVLASQTRLRRRGPLLLVLLAFFSLGLMLFSRSTSLPVSIVLLAATASMAPAYMALTNMLLLELSPPAMRGRVMSLMSLDRGLIPVGAALAGALAASIGPQDGLLLMGGVCLALTAVATLAVPALRRL